MIGLLACFIPLFICFFVLLFKFKLKITHLLLAILFGLIAILPISFIQYFIPDFKLFFTNQILGQLIKSFLLYGFIEEIFKMLFLLPLTKNKTEIKRIYKKLFFIKYSTFLLFLQILNNQQCICNTNKC